MHENFDKLSTKLKYMMDKNIVNDDWSKRPIIKSDKYLVPAYYEGLQDSDGKFSRQYLTNTTSTEIYEYIIKNKDKYKNKKIIDMATGTGLGAIMLADASLKVVGVDRNKINFNGAIYTMALNDIYYDLVYSNERYVRMTDYDVLIINETFRCWEFVDRLVPLIRREKKRGKEVLFWTRKNHEKLLNFEKYRPKNIIDPLNTPAIELY